MQEREFKIQISGIRLTAILFDEAFRIKEATDGQGIMARLKTIHQHATYEIFFIQEGTLTVNGEENSAVYENAAVIIPPHLNHYTIPRVSKGYCMYFSLTAVPTGEGKGLFDVVTAELGGRVTALPLGEEERFYIDRFAQLPERGDAEDAVHLLALLFSSLFRRFRHSPPSSHAQSKYGQYIHTLDLYISGHYSEHICLADLAAELHLCPKQIARIIRKEHGCSLSELVNDRRLAAACMLLKYTSLDVVEVAANVGYEHENYFFTLFKKKYGITPGQYRESKKAQTVLPK